MTDVFDQAQAREEEIRQDALAAWGRKMQPVASESAQLCTLCDEPIPEGRRTTLPGVQTCVPCQQELESALRGVR